MVNTRRNASNLRGLRSRLGLSKKCPPGQVLRAPQKRRFSSTVKKSGQNVHRGNKTIRVQPGSASTIVKAACIKNRGLPGKGPRSGKEIGPLREGELSRYGQKTQLSTEQRHEALKKAMAVQGPLSVFRKLDAVAKLTLRTAPEAHKIFVADRSWVQNNQPLRKNATFSA